MNILTTIAYAQDTKQIMSELALAGSGSSGQSGILNFSWPGLIGNLLFSSIGFIAFSYGKKNSEMKTMLIGIGLMGYAYFVGNTTMIYVVGVVLTALLFWGG